jgi:hypothetical protein
VYAVAVSQAVPDGIVPRIVDKFDAVPEGWSVLNPVTVPSRRGKAFPSSYSHYRRREVVSVSVLEEDVCGPTEV